MEFEELVHFVDLEVLEVVWNFWYFGLAGDFLRGM